MPPNLFLLAAPRSGSTQLSAWLASHVDVALPPIKEPNHYSQHEFPQNYVDQNHLNDVDPAKYVASASQKQMQFAIFRDPDHYAYLFENLRAKWRMDASTTYLHCPEAPKAIHAAAPEAKVIILTRDPVSRALSHYRLAVRTGRTTRTLREELEAERSGDTPLAGRFLLRPSLHDAALARCRRVFPDGSRLEIKFEDMIADIEGTLDQIADFLGIDTAGFDIRVDSQNAGDAPRFKALNAWLLRSGIKTSLRRLLPISIKQKLKAIYFKPNTDTVDNSDLELLRDYLKTSS